MTHSTLSHPIRSEPDVPASTAPIPFHHPASCEPVSKPAASTNTRKVPCGAAHPLGNKVQKEGSQTKNLITASLAVTVFSTPAGSGIAWSPIPSHPIPPAACKNPHVQPSRAHVNLILARVGVIESISLTARRGRTSARVYIGRASQPASQPCCEKSCSELRVVSLSRRSKISRI